MSTTELTKTYSFKAPRTWDARIDQSLRMLAGLPGFDSEAGSQVRHELGLAILRRPERLTRATNQSDLMRAVVELLLAATEKVERDRALGDAYEAAAGDRDQDEVEFTRASTRAAARRWH